MGSSSLQSSGQGQVTRLDRDGAETQEAGLVGAVSQSAATVSGQTVLYLATGLESKYTKQERGLEVVDRL